MNKTAGQRLTLDKGITLPRRRGPKAARRLSVRDGLCLSLVLGLVSITSIEESLANKQLNHPDNLKLYSLQKMGWDQFECYNWLIIKESRWDPSARNGSHYGLGQMRNSKVAGLTPREQIDWHWRYIKHRYPKGKACAALAHLDRKGWH